MLSVWVSSRKDWGAEAALWFPTSIHRTEPFRTWLPWLWVDRGRAKSQRRRSGRRGDRRDEAGQGSFQSSEKTVGDAPDKQGGPSSGLPSTPKRAPLTLGGHRSVTGRITGTVRYDTMRYDPGASLHTFFSSRPGRGSSKTGGHGMDVDGGWSGMPNGVWLRTKADARRESCN